MKSIGAKDFQLEISSSPDDPVKNAWKDFILKGQHAPEQVRPEILRSWVRCREIGVDPFTKCAPIVLSNSELKSLLTRNRELIEISKPVIDMIEISIRETGFIFTLTDKDGYVLVVHGDKDILEMAEHNCYVLGCLRSIEHAGTNAIGVCLAEKKPIQITGAEHYKIHHHPWTCSSAPVCDSQGNLLGAITLSGKSIGRHRHTLALVTAAAETIESQLRERALTEDKQRLSSILNMIFNAISDGLIAVDNSLEVIRFNKKAAEMLGLNANSVEGNLLTKVVQSDDSLIRSIKEKNYLSNVEIGFNSPIGQKSYICSSDPVRNASGHILGAIITMTEKRQVINIAQKFGGNYAKYEFKDIIGNSSTFKKQIEIAKIAARTNSKVLIIGESGTGKELFAQAIHNHSHRRNEPFVAISCAAIPRDLIESELFGYKGGAFTGARREGQMGKFELANKGTLFLDEVNGLPLELQAKLLRVLQQKEITRLGDRRTIPVDVKVIAASNIDLISEVENKNFREDLYYRLNVVEIVIPPLRERAGDLILLIDHILSRHCNEMGIKNHKISDEVIEIMRSYHWPGNVRELENCIERALLVSQGSAIQREHLSIRPLKKEIYNLSGTTSLRQGYKEMIEATLDRCGGNVTKAVKELRIARSTLYRKKKEFGI